MIPSAKGLSKTYRVIILLSNNKSRCSKVVNSAVIVKSDIYLSKRRLYLQCKRSIRYIYVGTFLGGNGNDRNKVIPIPPVISIMDVTNSHPTPIGYRGV